MAIVISAKFSAGGKHYYFDPHGLELEKGQFVVVETIKGLEFAECVRGQFEVSDENLVTPLRPVVRLATELDISRHAEASLKNHDALERSKAKVEEFGLAMKLISAEHSFDGSQITIYFSSDGRVDFRELVRELSFMFKSRIKLLQIGVRDEAKVLGGLGLCGREFCCSRFLESFHGVSIKMAKTQGLSLNPAKISGSCGRLMCCLKYEEDAYKELNQAAPKLDAFVETPGGKGSVTNVNLLRRLVKGRLEDGGDTQLKTFSFDELTVLGGRARRAEYQAARDSGTLEAAGFKASVVSGAQGASFSDNSGRGGNFRRGSSASPSMESGNAPARPNPSRGNGTSCGEGCTSRGGKPTNK